MFNSDLAAGMMPPGRFGANAAWLWLAALALLRGATYGPEWCWMRMKRIRAIWLHLAARLVRHRRRLKLVLGAADAHLMASRQRMNLAMPPSAGSGTQLTPAPQGDTTRRTQHRAGRRRATAR